MFLESIYTVISALVILGLFILLYFLLKKRRIKMHKLLDNGAYVTNYFIDHENYRSSEFVPSRNKPVNKLNDSIFMATSFCLFIDYSKVVTLKYDEIYWTYGEVAPSKPGKKNKVGFEVLVLKSLSGTYRVYVKKQGPFVRYLAQMGIPAGYSEEVKKNALEYKEILKNKKRGNKHD